MTRNRGLSNQHQANVFLVALIALPGPGVQNLIKCVTAFKKESAICLRQLSVLNKPFY